MPVVLIEAAISIIPSIPEITAEHPAFPGRDDLVPIKRETSHLAPDRHHPQTLASILNYRDAKLCKVACVGSVEMDRDDRSCLLVEDVEDLPSVKPPRLCIHINKDWFSPDSQNDGGCCPKCKVRNDALVPRPDSKAE